MQFRAPRLVIALCLAWGTCATGPLWAGSSVYKSSAKQAAARRSFIAVMGAVEQSGVFEVPEPIPPLGKLLQQAGGLAAGATGNIHVIRRGRMTLQTHVTTGMNVPLRPGDVVIAGGAGGRHRRDASALIEVAIVGLVERPVVVRLRPEHARVEAIASLLGQDSRAAARVRVIGSRGRRLSNGSIVAFDPATVRRDRIPSLPPPTKFRSDPSRKSSAPRHEIAILPRAGSTSGTGIRTTSMTAPPGRVKVQGTPTASTDEAERIARLMQSARKDLAEGNLDGAKAKAYAASRSDVDFRKLNDRPEWILAEIAKRSSVAASAGPQNPAGETSRRSSPQRLSVAEENNAAAPFRRATTASTRELPSTAGPSVNPASHEATSPAEELTAPAAADADASHPPEPQPASVEETPNAEAPFTIDPLMLLVGVFACLGLLSAAGFLWSMGRRVAAVSKSAPPRQTLQRASRLDQLIRNELEVCECPVATPEGVEFFGQTHGLQRNRMDEPHRRREQRPHFQPDEDEAPVLSPSRERQQLQDRSRRADAAQPVPPVPAAAAAGGVPDRPLPRAAQEETA